MIVRFLTGTGAVVLAFFIYLGELVVLAGESVRSALTHRMRWRLFLRQMVDIGLLSQLVVVITGSFTGKDSLLSGPAGGVVGFSRVAAAAGFHDRGTLREGVSREDMDAFGALSQQRACANVDNGFFEREITPVTLADGTVISKDDGPRAGTTVEKLAQLKPVFRPDGSVTAGNACPLNDGAAAVIVMSDTKAKELGLNGGLLLPVNYYNIDEPFWNDRRYEPLWSLCSELDMPLHTHVGPGSPYYGEDNFEGMLIWAMESTFWVHRPLWFFTFSGILERHPNLKIIAVHGGGFLGAKSVGRKARR